MNDRQVSVFLAQKMNRIPTEICWPCIFPLSRFHNAFSNDILCECIKWLLSYWCTLEELSELVNERSTRVLIVIFTFSKLILCKSLTKGKTNLFFGALNAARRRNSNPWPSDSNHVLFSVCKTSDFTLGLCGPFHTCKVANFCAKLLDSCNPISVGMKSCYNLKQGSFIVKRYRPSHARNFQFSFFQWKVPLWHFITKVNIPKAPMLTEYSSHNL